MRPLLAGHHPRIPGLPWRAQSWRRAPARLVGLRHSRSRRWRLRLARTRCARAQPWHEHRMDRRVDRRSPHHRRHLRLGTVEVNEIFLTEIAPVAAKEVAFLSESAPVRRGGSRKPALSLSKGICGCLCFSEGGEAFRPLNQAPTTNRASAPG